jgi:tRNA 2-thiouridine synthesizing protein B
MILHTVNKYSDCISACMSVADKEDAVLLLEDGVYAALDMDDNRHFWASISTVSRHYVLEADLAARGISDKMLARFNVVSWQDFVALSAESDKVISWG